MLPVLPLVVSKEASVLPLTNLHTARKAPKPGANNTVFVNPVPAQKVRRFTINPAPVSQAIAQNVKREANPVHGQKFRRPVARARRMANLATANQNVAARRDALTVITAGAHAARHGDHELN